MSKIDQKYIDALDTFTESLEKIVETLKEQQKSGVADVVNDFLKAPMDNLVTVVEELKDVTQKGFKEVKNDNKEILKKIESIKKQKESGMFDKIEDPKNKNKIVDGIKVVILIAAGVLALGLAFKIVGKVDFLSVIALSAAMYIMSQTFSKIADIKGLKYSEILKIAAFMPIMALGIAISGVILKKMPVITFQQGLSILFIGGSLGVASYMLLKAMSNISPKSLLLAPFIPFLLPLIALGIVKSSEILPGIKSISFRTVIDVALIGIAMGVATFVIGLALKHMKNITWKEMLMVPIMLPLIASGIVLASYILKDFDPVKDPLKMLIGVATIGLSILVFYPAIKLLSKLKMEEVFKGGLAAVAVSGVILATAWIFSVLPDNMKYPDIMWSLGAGLSVLTFGLMTLGLGIAITLTAGLGLAGIALGALAVLMVAGTIVATSYLLQAGKYDGNYPSLQWSLGVGAALLGFSLAMIAASAAGISSAIGSLFTGGEDPLAKVARSMVEVSYAIQAGKYDGNYPKEDWAKGVGTALLLFTTATVLAAAEGTAVKILSFFTGDNDPLMTMTKSIVAVSKEIQNGVYTGNYPSLGWAAGVGAVLLEFSTLAVAVSALGIVSALGKLLSGDSDPLMTVAKSITSVSREFQNGVYTGNYPKMDWIVQSAAALGAFAVLLTGSAISGLISKFTSIFTGDKDPILTLAKSITSISKEFLTGQYVYYPDRRWTNDVYYALNTFSKMATTLSSGNILDRATGNNPLMSIAQTMTGISKVMSTGKWNTPIPDKKYTDALTVYITNLLEVAKAWDYDVDDAIDFNQGISNVSAGLKSMSGIRPIPGNLSTGYTLFFNSLKAMPKLTESDSKIKAVKTLTDRFAEMADTLGRVNINLQKFVDNYNRLDIKKLDQLSTSVDKSATALGVKKAEEDRGILSNIASGISNLLSGDNKEKTEVVQKQVEAINKKQEKFYDDISEIRRLLTDMKDDANKPTKAGSFHK